MLQDANLQIPLQPGQTLIVNGLLRGYAAYEVQKNGVGRSADAKDPYVYGHPRGIFKSVPTFFVQYRLLHRYGTSHNCPCCLCSPETQQSTGRMGTRLVDRQQDQQSRAPSQFQPAGTQIIAAPTMSDGTGVTDSRPNAINNDGHFLDGIAKYLAAQHNLPGGSYRLEKLQTGYSGSQTQCSNGIVDS